MIFDGSEHNVFRELCCEDKSSEVRNIIVKSQKRSLVVGQTRIDTHVQPSPVESVRAAKFVNMSILTKVNNVRGLVWGKHVTVQSRESKDLGRAWRLRDIVEIVMRDDGIAGIFAEPVYLS